MLHIFKYAVERKIWHEFRIGYNVVQIYKREIKRVLEQTYAIVLLTFQVPTVEACVINRIIVFLGLRYTLWSSSTKASRQTYEYL